MRISEKMDIKATAYDKRGRMIATLYDSGFNSLDQIVNALRRKACNPPKFDTVRISANDGEQFGLYKVYNTCIKKVF